MLTNYKNITEATDTDREYARQYIADAKERDPELLERAIRLLAILGLSGPWKNVDAALYEIIVAFEMAFES